MPHSRHLLVDGFNFAHAQPPLRALLRRRLDAAVARVVEQVRVLHDVLDWSVTIVFDGQGRQLSIEHPDETETLTVVYSASGQTADSVIEQMLARTPTTEGWRVASNDRALAQMAIGSGAEVISSEALADWIARAEGQASDALRRRQARVESAWRRGGPAS